MYKVIADFADMQDGGYVYHTGDKFPRDGVEADPARLAVLLTNTNRLQKPLIEETVIISTDSAETARSLSDESESKTETEDKPESKTDTEDKPRKRGRKKKPEENEV